MLHWHSSKQEDAIALLIGTPASDFSLPAAPLAALPPAVPVGLPSGLLERRPDIAAAERRVAAANAQIGIVEAAFYPNVTLSASGGFASSALSTWLSWPSRLWAVGPAIAETLFEGGLRRAQTEAARAAYDSTVALYRQTVLTGFEEVEDNLAALRILEEEARVQGEAVKAAQQAVTVTTNQYRAGTLSYLNVLVAQTAALHAEAVAVDVLGSHESIFGAYDIRGVVGEDLDSPTTRAPGPGEPAKTASWVAGKNARSVTSVLSLACFYPIQGKARRIVPSLLWLLRQSRLAL